MADAPNAWPTLSGPLLLAVPAAAQAPSQQQPGQ